MRNRADRTRESVDVRRRHGHARGGAFTLIELLVVVSIIALLISILLPSLRRARDQAKAVVCGSGIGGILRGMVTYSADWNGWIPGSPGTSGSVLLGLSSPPAEDEEIMPDAPTQIFDWAGPILAGTSQLSVNRAHRYEEFVEKLFVCAANQYDSQPFFNYDIGPHGNFGIVKMNSYNTIRQFVLWPRTFTLCPDSSWGECAPFIQAQFDPQIGGLSTAPKGYKPNLDRVARPSRKVFIADGSRYTTDDSTIDHDISWDAPAGGSFSDGGPTLAEQYLRGFMIDEPASAYTYRHYLGKDRAVEVGFFDGHAELMSRRLSRFPDPWWPKGSLIPFGSEFNEQTRTLLIEMGRDDGLVEYDSVLYYEVQ
ncbi:MAG: prepilin-type N-terminal cleavage/methylation domain-containing protein [Planctomycetes bacterium]|nr:prepilin-type N-terminal cleavage/methylation domain-containing protein [Planctomycetota bacterium]